MSSILHRLRFRWPGWLAWVLPASIGLIVVGYQIFYQAALNPARSLGIFWGEVLIFGVVGPLVAWVLLRQLALDAAAGRAAAEQISALAAEERRRAQEVTALYAVSATLNQALSEEDALKQALSRTLDVLSLESGRIYLLDAQSGQLVLAAAQGTSMPPDVALIAVAPDSCLCSLAAQTGVLQRSSDAADPYLNGCCQCRSGYACAGVPLLAKEHALGFLHVARRQATRFSEEDLALLCSLGAQIGVAVENMRLREEARRAEALSTLIQEMHHRIKNNLQTVADLLSLEMSASPSPAARKSLRDSISRIKSIAAVHELLSLEQLRLTDITELARQVCDISLRHLVRPDQHVAAEITGPAIYLPSKQATALALVINELISNALEHAFSLNGRGGRLVITTAQEGAQVIVTVTDNGRGLSLDFDQAARRGMGLQIAHTLVEKDLAGSLRLQNASEGGTRATLTFYK